MTSTLREEGFQQEAHKCALGKGGDFLNSSEAWPKCIAEKFSTSHEASVLRIVSPIGRLRHRTALLPRADKQFKEMCGAMRQFL